MGSVTKGAYKPKDLERCSNTGWSIVDDEKFVTESVDTDFSKEDVQRDPIVLLHKVQDKMLSCSTTPEDLDAIRFLTIIGDFKVSNFGHIFSQNGVLLKVEQPEFLVVKLLFRCTLATPGKHL